MNRNPKHDLTHNQNRPLSIRALEGLSSRGKMHKALFAARMAFVYWQRTFPEKELQTPFFEALNVVERFLADGILLPNAKAIAEAAYSAVSQCDLPPGDIQRSSGFAVAHVAMLPWLFVNGSHQKVAHNSKVAVSYTESIFRWAGRLSELEAALSLNNRELADT